MEAPRVITLFEYLDILVAAGRMSIEDAMAIRLQQPRQVITCRHCDLYVGDVETIRRHEQDCPVRRADGREWEDDAHVQQRGAVIDYLRDIGEWDSDSDDDERELPEFEEWELAHYPYVDEYGERRLGRLGPNGDVNDRIARLNPVPWARQCAELEAKVMEQGPYEPVGSSGSDPRCVTKLLRDIK